MKRPTGEDVVTFKWLAGAVMGVMVGGAVLTGSAYAWLDAKMDEKVDVIDYDDVKGDIKFIRECMVKKCWDRP